MRCCCLEGVCLEPVHAIRAHGFTKYRVDVLKGMGRLGESYLKGVCLGIWWGAVFVTWAHGFYEMWVDVRKECWFVERCLEGVCWGFFLGYFQ